MGFTDFLNTTKNALGSALKIQGLVNPATRIPTMMYGAGKMVGSFFNQNKNLPSGNGTPTVNAPQVVKSLQTQSPLNLFPLPKSENSSPSPDQQSASLSKPVSPTPKLTPPSNNGSNYSTPQYDYGNTGNDGSNFKPDTQGKTTDFFGKPYTPYTDSGSQSESQSTTPVANPYNDRLKALQDKLNGLNEGLMGYLKPGDEERNTQTQLDALQGRLKGINASKELGLANISNQPIAMNFITGQSANLQRQAAAQAGALGAEAEPLTTRLARLQADRQQGFDAAKYQIGNAQGELERLQKEANPIEVGGNLVRLNPATGQYETIFKNPKVADEGFTLGEGQMRYDAKGNLIASGAPKSSAEQLTNDIKEYNFARQQGYTGSFTDYKNSQASGGSGLPSAYREYQLSQNDPGFAQYLNRNSVNGNGRPLSDSQAKLISEGNQLGQSLQPLYNLIQNQSNLFGPWNGLGGYDPFNTDAQSANAQLKTAAQLVGGYLEGGKLTDQDIGRYQNILPKLTDTPAVAKNKLDSIAKLIKNKQQQYLQDFGSAGFNTSGFGGEQFNQYQSQLRQGEILVQDRQGNIGAISANEFDPNKYTRMQGFNSPLNTGLKGSVQQKFPEGAKEGQCGDFAHKLVQFPSVGDTLSQKRATVDRIGIPASVWRSNAKVGDVVITNENPTYGHVAVVTEILPNGFRVSESNFKQSDRVSHDRIIPFNSPKIYGAVRGSIKV